MSKESGGNQPSSEFTKEEQKFQDNFKLLPDEYKVFWDEGLEKNRKFQAEQGPQFLEFVKDLNPRYVDFLSKMLDKEIQYWAGIKKLERTKLELEYLEGCFDEFEQKMEFFRNNYLLPLTDPEAIEALQFLQKDSLEVATKKVAAFRTMAREQFNYNQDDQPIVSLSRAGFTIKESAPYVHNQWDPEDEESRQIRLWHERNFEEEEEGLCYYHWKHLKSVGFFDTPTEDEIRYFVPRIVPNSTDLSCRQQEEQVAQTQQALHQQSPEYSVITLSIGEANKLAQQILAHYNETGERIPLYDDWVHTSTLTAGGSLLGLGWTDARLWCDTQRLVHGENPDSAAFALGVEKLKNK